MLEILNQILSNFVAGAVTMFLVLGGLFFFWERFFIFTVKMYQKFWSNTIKENEKDLKESKKRYTKVSGWEID